MLTSEKIKDLQKNRGGLEGIIAVSTAISKVEGLAGRLVYQGYNIHDLVGKVTFEEVAYLLWRGKLPTRAELANLKAQISAERNLPEAVLQTLKILPDSLEPMDALRTLVSTLGAVTIKGRPTLDQAIALTARFPLILAAFQRQRQGLDPLTSKPELGHAANYLYLLTGKEPLENQVRALDAYLVLLADHGMNASTFTARIVASTESDMVSSVVAALGALKGPLHGGAPSKVQDMLVAIGTEEKAEGWLRSAIARKEKLMGFGHRVYKTEDPRRN